MVDDKYKNYIQMKNAYNDNKLWTRFNQTVKMRAKPIFPLMQLSIII